jgi:hypothetical protein
LSVFDELNTVKSDDEGGGDGNEDGDIEVKRDHQREGEGEGSMQAEILEFSGNGRSIPGKTGSDVYHVRKSAS